MCPTWVSDEKGIWHPAKESAPLKNLSNKPIKVIQTDDDGKKFTKTIPPNGDYIYEGPDRAALFQWWEENGKPSAKEMKDLDGNVTFGEDFRTNTEFLQQYANAKNMFGFKDVEEYLKYLGYDAIKRHAEFEKKASVVTKHDAPNRIEEAKRLGGGQDYATGKLNRYGDFGDVPNV